ncbi:hypothetical protein [Psychrilyobacter atlanticus]|uniref:hypothetical protein n=1 Tax=Psychrilyobacter atlanticus TaxID=271091 RepID=UPI0004177795|nr:hypothetical protein [Psychrilyobacter atlanticus]
MKKLILSMMLIMVFLSFSSNKDMSKPDFNNQKLWTKTSCNRSLFNDIDRHDFSDLRLRTGAGYNREEQKRKRKVMLTNVFNNESH